MPINLDEIKTKLYAAVFSDILDDLGYTNQVMEAQVRPLQPETVLAGWARTMLAVPEFHIPDPPYQAQIDAVDTLNPGDVIIAHVSRVTSSAFWGELFSSAAQARGAVGVVTDGYVRDVRKMMDLNFPVFTTGIYPVNSKGRCTVAAYDVTVRCGGVLVQPGDLVFGEIDGVVIVPGPVVDEVVSRALEVASKENKMQQELRHGSTLRAAWEKYRVL